MCLNIASKYLYYILIGTVIDSKIKLYKLNLYSSLNHYNQINY